MDAVACITRLAHAKLNLALSVGPREGDGYHPIASWMVTIDLADELSLTALPTGRLSRYAIMWHEHARQRSEIDWSIRKDLSVRAHLALEQHVGRPLPVQMKLEKRIPVGGGLGGGSADAAAMLLAVNELFELALAEEELTTIAHGLGADVPFLLRGGSAIVEGRGEAIERHDEVPAIDAVVILPPLQSPTGAVYTAFDEQGGGTLRAADVRALPRMLDGRRDAMTLFNDLAAAAMSLAPRLREHAGEITRIAERPAHMSGSGSTLFVICDDPLHAEALARAIEERSELPAVVVRTVMPGA